MTTAGRSRLVTETIRAMAAERGIDLEALCAATSDKDEAGRELFGMAPLMVPRLFEFAEVLDVKASDILIRALGEKP